jgi:tetratricopeptide (TPR) repeat protein
MADIKKRIESLFKGKKQIEQDQYQIPSTMSVNSASIANSVYVKKGDVSMDNANFGIQYYVYVNADPPSSTAALDSSVMSKLDSIQELFEKCKFTDALAGYKELLEDYTVMNAVDESVRARVLLGIISSYVSLSEFSSAEKYLKQLKKDKLPLNEKGYSIIVSYYLSQRNPALYKDAECIAVQAIKDFPDSVICICLYALVKSLVDDSFDGVKYLKDNISILDDEGDRKRYFETLCNILIINTDYDGVIATHKALDFKPSLILHSQYINALYVCCIYNKDKEYIVRSDIDFQKLYTVWQNIHEIEEGLTDDDTLYFRCLIADVYLNCIILLGNESGQIPKELLLHAHEETKDNFTFWISVYHEFNVDSDPEYPKNEKVKHVDSLLEQRKFKEILNYLWPAIQNDEELQRLFKYLLLSICIELRDEDPVCFVDVANFFKQAGLFDTNMKLIECTYVYHVESKKRSMQELEMLYTESQDPKLLLAIIRFAHKVGEYAFATEKLDDIMQTKPFVIDIEPNDFFVLSFNLYARIDQGWRFISLTEEASKHKIDDTLIIRMNGAKAEYLGNLPEVAAAYLQLFEQTGDIRFLYRSCELYLVLFDIKQLEKALEVLSRATHDDDINVSILYAHFYTLLGDPEKALESAKKAKELSVDLPMSPAHPLYWSLCFRNKDKDEFYYIYEYASKYPQHTQWVRSIIALEKDESGNDALTPEAIQIFEKQRDDYNKAMQLYKKRYEFGMSMIKDWMKWRFCDFAHHAGVLKTFPGNLEQFNSERQIGIDQIALDSFTLYYFEVLGCLDVLKNCSKVFIDYETISTLTSELLIFEDERIRKIFRFIRTSSNIVLTYPSQSGKEVLSKFEIEKKETSTFSSLLNACVIAHDNDVPLVYLDVVAQPISKITETKTVSLFAFIKSAYSRGWLKDSTLGKVVLKMAEHNFDFNNIDSTDLYFALEANKFTIDDSISKLIEIVPSVDTMSCVSVFVGLLQRLRAKGNNDIIEKVAISLIKSFDRRHGRTRADFFAGERIDSASFKRADHVRKACELGISSVCAFLFDFKSKEDIKLTIYTVATRVPEENYADIFAIANEVYSTHLVSQV